MDRLMIISQAARMREMVVLIKQGQILPAILLANENHYSATFVEPNKVKPNSKNIKNENQWQTKTMIKKNRTSPLSGVMTWDGST